MADTTGGTSALSGAKFRQNCSSSVKHIGVPVAYLVDGLVKCDVSDCQTKEEADADHGNEEVDSNDYARCEGTSCRTNAVAMDSNTSLPGLFPSSSPCSSLSPHPNKSHMSNNNANNNNNNNNNNSDESFHDDDDDIDDDDNELKKEKNDMVNVSLLPSTTTTKMATNQPYQSLSTLFGPNNGHSSNFLHRSCSLSSPDDWTIEHIAEDRHVPQRYTLGSGRGVHSLAWTNFDGSASESRFTFETTSSYETLDLWRSLTPPPFPIGPDANINHNNIDAIKIASHSDNKSEENSKKKKKRKKKKKEKENETETEMEKKDEEVEVEVEKEKGSAASCYRDCNNVNTTEDDHDDDGDGEGSGPKANESRRSSGDAN